MGRLSVWFDQEGDFLEVTTDRDVGSFNDLGNGIFERVDAEGNMIGFAVLNPAKRSTIELPFEAEFRRHTSAQS